MDLLIKYKSPGEMGIWAGVIDPNARASCDVLGRLPSIFDPDGACGEQSTCVGAVDAKCLAEGARAGCEGLLIFSALAHCLDAKAGAEGAN